MTKGGSLFEVSSNHIHKAVKERIFSIESIQKPLDILLKVMTFELVS